MSIDDHSPVVTYVQGFQPQWFEIYIMIIDIICNVLTVRASDGVSVMKLVKSDLRGASNFEKYDCSIS